MEGPAMSNRARKAVVAVGAGAGSRRSLGTAVFGGMVAAAIFVPIFVHMFFKVIQGLREKIKGSPKVAEQTE